MLLDLKKLQVHWLIDLCAKIMQLMMDLLMELMVCSGQLV